ncbi:N-methyl-D-aspartate receptor NMDAR2C subunit [Marinicella sediminis]|uniref:N-methyl-D-aspartate receptor NMDAR2C subunit n=1 Tax=Marinicella sediminis TaxID=1792834 RepID=A0ABV7J482_9GAMM|nr:hypothetical protein [Marinicella sediminis]
MNEKRWLRLMKLLGFAPSLDCFGALNAAYAEKHRQYHTGAHIDAMLRHLDDVVHLADRPVELEVAIWFHDAIYKPFSSHNEADSANWAAAFLAGHDFLPAGVERVKDLIMATVHEGEVASGDQALLVDIDLSILGAREEVYDQYEQHIRKEYHWVPGFIYRKKRRQLLHAFLQKRTLYHLDVFQQRFEKKARHNLQRTIVLLS